MNKGFTAMLLVIVAVCGSSHRVEAVPHSHMNAVLKDYDDSDAYDVYAAVLNEQLPPTGHSEQLVIVNSTAHYEVCDAALKEQDERIRAAIQSYKLGNQSLRRLIRKFPFQRDYLFVTEEEITTTFKKQRGWETFNRNHPNAKGFIELSAVGFSADKKIAVVYDGYHCGGLCGSGALRVLEKKDGTWRYVETSFSCQWLS